MAGNNDFTKDSVKHSAPITIGTTPRRARSVSVSSGSGSSDSSVSEVQTPTSPTGGSPKIGLPPAGSSPILSYFLSTSPTAKTPGANAFPSWNRKFGPPPVFEEPENDELPVSKHARRATTIVTDRFNPPSAGSIPEPQLERGSGLLRRLSLSSGAFTKPQFHQPPSPPPPTATSPIAKSMPFSRETRPRRSATINEGTKPRRAPSPMGERILKGHFDGFN